MDSTQEVFVHNIVVLSGIRPKGRTVKMKKNGRSTHGLLYIWKGEATFYPDNKSVVTATHGQLLYLPKSLKYKMQFTADGTTFVLINFDLLEEGKNPFDTKDITLLAQDDTLYSVANIMAKLEVCGASRNTASQFRRKELFYRLLSLIHYNNPDIESTHYPQIVKGVMLLRQTYLENLPIEVFAKESAVSVSSFRQLFNKQFGTSPLQYRNLLRIQRAKQLLEYDNCTVAEAAYASGFESVSYFCRYYKKITGETPKQKR